MKDMSVKIWETQALTWISEFGSILNRDNKIKEYCF